MWMSPLAPCLALLYQQEVIKALQENKAPDAPWKHNVFSLAMIGHSEQYRSGFADASPV